MRQIVIAKPGPPEALRVEQAPPPQIGSAHVLIRVAAAGVNRPDIMQRQGKYPPPAGASPIPGLEVAGHIEESKDDRWRPGDPVCALVAGGGYAEFCAAPAPQCLPIPSGLSMVEAAALPETFFTVWANLFQRGRLAAGETVLIHGGSSGIGTTAIQLAHAFGAHVIATAGSDEKCAACLSLGADIAINYRTTNFADQAQSVDVILDMVGGRYFPLNIKSLAPEGRLIQIATLEGNLVELDLHALMTRGATVTGSTLRPRTIEQKGKIARELEAKVWPLLASGRVKPIIHATFPLEQAAAAHALMESGSHIGKIVLTLT